MVSQQELMIFTDVNDLNDAAAGFIADIAQLAIRSRGRFTVALTGGPEPPALYHLLVSPSWRDRIDWDRWYFFFGDERVVPPTDPNSNFGMAEEFLLSKLTLSPSQVHRAPTEIGEPDDVAAQYEADIRSFFEVSTNGWPKFDLVLLGLGSDGHIASLFPGKPTLDVDDRLVVASPPGTLPPPLDRVTFTLPLINAARAIAFIVEGSEKAPALRAARNHVPLGGTAVVPAARVRPTDGQLRWFVDTSAAAL